MLVARNQPRARRPLRRAAWVVLLSVVLAAVAGATTEPLPVALAALPTQVRGQVPAVAQEAGIAAPRATAYDWLQFNGDAQHSGNNTQETLLDKNNVGRLKLLFNISMPGPADGAAAYLTGITTPTGVRDLLFVNTADGRTIAVDANTGAQVWAHQYGPGTCTYPLGQPCYTTSSPAVDPNRAYVYSYGLDGKVHKYAVGNGNEVTTGGWPEVATLKGNVEKGSSDLTVVTTATGASYLYVANSGYPGDFGDYQGHITTINLATGGQQVFNVNCSNQTVHFVLAPGAPDCPAVQNAVWGRGGVVYVAATGLIYTATGNGPFDPANHYWGDSVFSLNPDGTGAAGNPLQTYTPTNYQALQTGDLDLGSTSPAILPVPATSKVPHLAVQGGKDATLRLLNLDNLSGQGGTGHTGGELSSLPLPQGGEMLTAAAVWRNPSDGSTWTFIANLNGISALQLTIDAQGNPHLQPRWQQAQGGASPLVANGVLYYAGNATSTTGFIRALDPVTGNQLWQDTTNLGTIHWESPIVANGILYITDAAGRVVAYALPHYPPRAYLPSIGR